MIRLYEGEAPPRADEFDLLVVMGGPMSIHDETDYEWLVPEKRLIAQCLDRGSRVYRNRVREMGWFPIRWRQDMVIRDPRFAGPWPRKN